MTKTRDRAVEGRNDLSRFVVHLTRDDQKDDPVHGRTAEENFEGIMNRLMIYALRPHCLHKTQIPDKHREKFAVCCFTEVPLQELHLLTRSIKGRRNQYSDYGVVFSREFLMLKGAQPAIYLNSYGKNSDLSEAADRIFELAKAEGFRGKLSRLIPYMNHMNEGYDFAWEREWRIVGDLKFELEDIVCLILPEQGEMALKREFLESGVPVISPGWTTERIIDEFSKQARRARRIWRAKKRSKTNDKRRRNAR